MLLFMAFILPLPHHNTALLFPLKTFKTKPGFVQIVSFRFCYLLLHREKKEEEQI